MILSFWLWFGSDGFALFLNGELVDNRVVVRLAGFEDNGWELRLIG